MAIWRICFGCVCSLQALFLVANFAVRNEALQLDLNLTRREITTFLGQPANLGCYATNTNSSLTYTWKKGNQTVTQSSNVRAFGDLLVVTPKEEADFGTYECNVSNGVSSTRCIISLSKSLKSLKKTENEGGNSTGKDQSTTGCVNVSVLMPVLAVAVMSLLLFIHLLIQGQRSRDNQMIARMMKRNKKAKNSSRHTDRSTAVIEEPVEMHVNGQAPRSPAIAHASSWQTKHEDVTQL